MPKIKTRKLLGSWSKRLGLKKSYDLDDLDDLLEDALKGLKRWLMQWWRNRGRKREKKPAQRQESGRFRAADHRQKTAVAPQAQQSALSSAIRSQYERALTYQAEINELARLAQDDVTHERMEPVVEQVTYWMTIIADLIERVELLQQNELFQSDRKQVPKAVAALEKQLAKEEDPLLRRELERALTSRQQQQESLQKLGNTIRLAEIKIENTVSMLGTFYSQLLISQSKGKVADYRHLLHEVNEEVARLQDYLDALEEVKLGQLT